MRIGLFTREVPRNGIDDTLQAIRAAGFACCQLSLKSAGLEAMPDRLPAEDVLRIRQAAEAAGVEIAAVSGTYNMVHPDPAERATGLRRLEVVAAGCRGIGSGLVTLCTGSRDAADMWRRHPDNDTPEAWRDLLHEMTAAVLVAERHDVLLGIEPELANVVSSAAHARRLIDEIDSDRLRIVLDPANLFEVAPAEDRRRLVEEAVDLLADRIAIAHAKDRSAAGAFTAAGRGVIDYRHMVARLRRAGFDGPLIAHGLRESDLPLVRATLDAAL